ncbi:hypothetical protein BUC_7405 [Burkholderia pseudomallei 576]|nr:hypothetical protein BUC_7405 [Burkholderia pseudomallei 576]
MSPHERGRGCERGMETARAQAGRMARSTRANAVRRPRRARLLAHRAR